MQLLPVLLSCKQLTNNFKFQKGTATVASFKAGARGSYSAFFDYALHTLHPVCIAMQLCFLCILLCCFEFLNNSKVKRHCNRRFRKGRRAWIVQCLV
jgi:hypothetical protein